MSDHAVTETTTTTIRRNRDIVRLRTVNDFFCEDDLRRGLMTTGESCGDADGLCRDDRKIDPDWDWALSNYDRESTEGQSINCELTRLQVLKSYEVLDAHREPAFERITGLTARLFGVPICLVSLVDLGRQWFLSNRGLGDIRETARKCSFCAHAILSKRQGEVFVVRDTRKDDRFRDNPLVTGPPSIRFYAGAPLISPEGHKLGTLCVMDNKPRGEDLTLSDKANLIDLAATTVKRMVDRRNLCSAKTDPAHAIACVAHDLLMPLSGVQRSLSRLDGHSDVQRLGEHTKELIHTAAKSADIMLRICQTTSDGFQTRALLSSTTTSTINTKKPNSNNTNSNHNHHHHHHPNPNHNPNPNHHHNHHHNNHFNHNHNHNHNHDNYRNNNHNNNYYNDNSSTAPSPCERRNPCCIDIQEFSKTLHQIIDPIPKLVPCVISIDKSVPAKVLVADDLKILRPSLNLLSHACSVSETDSILFRVYTRERTNTTDNCECSSNSSSTSSTSSTTSGQHLVFECQDTGKNIDIDNHDRLFRLNDYSHHDDRNNRHISHLGFVSIASQIDAMGGQYGFRPRGLGEDGVTPQLDSLGRPKVGSIFWFSFPIELRQESDGETIQRVSSSSLFSSSTHLQGAILHSIGARATRATRATHATQGTANATNWSSSRSTGPSTSTIRNSSSSANSRTNNFFLTGSTPSSTRCVSPIHLLRLECTSHPQNRTNSEKSGSERLSPRSWSSQTLSSKREQPMIKTTTTTKKKQSTSLEQAVRMSMISASPSSEEHRVASSLMRRLRRKRALIIEDSTVLRKCLNLSLGTLGYDVVEAVNGFNGLQLLQKEMFDLCLCDFLMPVMGGIDCVRKFREWEKVFRPSPFRQHIVGISAHVGKHDIAKGLVAGMDEFRAKPITHRVLSDLDGSVAVQHVSSILDGVNAGVVGVLSSSEGSCIRSSSETEMASNNNNNNNNSNINNNTNATENGKRKINASSSSSSSRRNCCKSLMEDEERERKRMKLKDVCTGGNGRDKTNQCV